LRDTDFRAWPFGANELAPYYARAAEMLGVVQHEDDLARAYPLHGAVQPDLARNPGSAAERLLSRWRDNAADLGTQGFSGGRARLAVRTRGDSGDRCRACGLCFYGCAFDSIYSARRTLTELLGRDGFDYRAGRLVLDFHEENGRVHVRMRRTEDGAIERSSYDALFLGAGVLSSLRIAADSLGLHDRTTPLQDTDMSLLPVLLWGQRVPARFETAFTLGEVVLAVAPGAVSTDGIHLQFYSFHEYFLAELERPLRSLPKFLQRVAAAFLNNLLIAFVYTSGRESVRATAKVKSGSPIGCVEIAADPHPDHASIRRNLVRRLWRARKQLGFIPLSPLMKATPLGFSGHLAGTLPMRAKPGPLETSPNGLLAGTRCVHVVDSAAYPDMPAQNLTLTTVANAIRIAEAYNRS
jgi:choline dehydrogenase-like flavoprotein